MEFFAMFGMCIILSLIELLVSWLFSRIADSVEEFESAWIFSCIANSLVITYFMCKLFGII